MGKLTNFLDIMLESVNLLEEGGRSFSCLMLDIDNNTLHNILKSIDDEDLHEEGKETDSHITVKYGLHTKDHKEIFNFCEDWGKFPIDIKLHNFSIFENDEYDVLKLEVSSKALKDLNKKICENFEFTDSYPDYNPHTTLAYLKKGFGKIYVENLKLKFPNFDKKIICDKLVFSTADYDKFTKKIK